MNNLKVTFKLVSPYSGDMEVSVDNENKNEDIKNEEERRANRAAPDTDRSSTFQYHSSLAPAPPSYQPDKDKSAAVLKRQRYFKLFIITILALAVLACVSGSVAFALKYKLSFKGEDGGFTLRLIKRGQTELVIEPDDITIIPGTINGGNTNQPDGHVWNGSTFVTIKTDENSPRMDYKQIYITNSGSVVSVTSDYGREQTKATGTILTEDGYILTTCSAVYNSQSISVGIMGKKYAAAIVGLDYATDIAVIRIEAENLQAAVFGSSEEAAAGDRVSVVGNPVEDTMNLFSGMISAVNKDFTYRGYPTGIIQVNMSLGTGASGSPLINEYGQVIGIINMAIAYSYPEAGTISFALPISSIKSVIDDLMKYGYVPGRPSSGLAVNDLPSALAAYYGYPNGVVIVGINPESTAYAAGGRKGDGIFEANGVTIESTNDLLSIINSLSAGDELKLGLFRDGDKGYISFKLMEANAKNG